MRSIWKGHYLKKHYRSFDKSSTVFSFMVEKKLFFSNGKIEIDLIIGRNQVGRKFGEFIFSRKIGLIHRKQEKKIKRKK